MAEQTSQAGYKAGLQIWLKGKNCCDFIFLVTQVL